MNSQPTADLLSLDQQLCFPLYAASRLVTRLYQPLLEPLGLTYPQYIVLMILWEESPCSVTRIGERALLASNTLTPLLKRMEEQGLVVRSRASHDERVVTIALTQAGQNMRQHCACVPHKLFEQIDYPLEEALELKRRLDALLVRLSPG